MSLRVFNLTTKREMRWYQGKYRVEIIDHRSPKSLVRVLDEFTSVGVLYKRNDKVELSNHLLWKLWRKPKHP